jgi:hypothetical protein
MLVCSTYTIECTVQELKSGLVFERYLVRIQVGTGFSWLHLVVGFT